MAADGRPAILGTGPLTFTCVEPFRRWRVACDGTVCDGTVAGQIDRSFAIYADAPRPDVPRMPLSYDIELTMAAPAWVQDYRHERLAGMTGRERTDAGLMGYGYRIEQLVRGEGTLTLDGRTRAFRATGSRIHRQSARPMAAFRGHCWQSALFPDGRGFGYIACPLRDGEGEADRYDIGHVVQDGHAWSARATRIPFLRRVMPRGDDASVALVSDLGTWTVGGTTGLSTFHLGNAGMNGFHNQQGGVRYTLDDQVARGMIERSSPAASCEIVG